MASLLLSAVFALNLQTEQFICESDVTFIQLN